MRNSLVFVALLVALPAVAHAEPTQQLGLTLGLATPSGEISVDYARRIASQFELDVGAGEAFSGPQVSVMPRYRWGEGIVTGSIGGGLSAGRFHTWGFIDDTDASIETYALWGNLEAGVQATAHDGFFVRGFAGYSRMLVDTGWRCLSNCDGYRNEIQGLPYAGVSVGSAW